MNDQQITAAQLNRKETTDADDIGTGRKTGLYSFAFLILAILLVFIVLVFTGAYNPFEGTEGVGP